ncbi:MAG: M23 family metallopeptidase [Clostridia bacterium]|nr:M23 family metallopeptidase [Clostridia bacterium]
MSDRKEKDYYFPVLLCQIIIFTVLTVIIYFFGTQGDFKEKYLDLIDYNLDSVKISNAVETFRKNLYAGEIFTVLNIKDDYPVNGDKITNENEGTGGRDIELNKAADNASFSPVFATTKILNPVKNGRYTSYFGYRTNPISGNYAFHGGLDIAAPEGSIIRAAFNGKVIKSGFDSQAGNYIYLSHDNGFVTFYCHCSKLIAEKDAVVRQGETIALVGTTGYSTGPHLHFEVRRNNIRYDPLWLLER